MEIDTNKKITAKYAYIMFLQLSADELTELMNFRKELSEARRRYAGDPLEAMHQLRKEMERIVGREYIEDCTNWMADAADNLIDKRMMLYNAVFRLLAKHTNDPALATRCKMLSEFCVTCAFAYSTYTGKIHKKIGTFLEAVALWLGTTSINTDGNITMSEVNAEFAKFTKYFVNEIENKTKNLKQ